MKASNMDEAWRLQKRRRDLRALARLTRAGHPIKLTVSGDELDRILPQDLLRDVIVDTLIKQQNMAEFKLKELGVELDDEGGM